MNQWIVFDFLQKDNTVFQEIANVERNENVFLGKTYVLYESDSYIVDRISIKCQDTEYYIFVVFLHGKFQDGYVKKENVDKIYPIDSFARFRSLQIGEFAYDNICVITMMEKFL